MSADERTLFIAPSHVIENRQWLVDFNQARINPVRFLAPPWSKLTYGWISFGGAGHQIRTIAYYPTLSATVRKIEPMQNICSRRKNSILNASKKDTRTNCART
jgi:hypothetical protein